MIHMNNLTLLLCTDDTTIILVIVSQVECRGNNVYITQFLSCEIEMEKNQIYIIG